MTRTQEAIERCLDEEEYHSVARFSADTGDSEFTIEFGNQVADPPVWNLASDPPGDLSTYHEFIIRDCGDGYFLLESEAETVDEATEELEEIASTAGAGRVELVKTFAGAENPLKDLCDILDHYIVEPVRRRVD